MRTKEQIKFQIDGLTKQKENLPEFSFFGDPNHKVINAQISLLEGETVLGDYDEDYDDEGDIDPVYSGVLEAHDWLMSNETYDLFEID